MCVNNELAEATNIFLDKKLDWKFEIEMTIERLKKVERSLSSKEKELQEREFRLFQKERKMNIVKRLNKMRLSEWDATDVFIWMEQLGNEAVDLYQYGQVFLENHINGRRCITLDLSYFLNLLQLHLTCNVIVNHCFTNFFQFFSKVD